MLGSLFLGPTQAVGQGFCIWNNLDIRRKKKNGTHMRLSFLVLIQFWGHLGQMIYWFSYIHLYCILL